jgi:hypothetical protein
MRQGNCVFVPISPQNAQSSAVRVLTRHNRWVLRLGFGRWDSRTGWRSHSGVSSPYTSRITGLQRPNCFGSLACIGLARWVIWSVISRSRAVGAGMKRTVAAFVLVALISHAGAASQSDVEPQFASPAPIEGKYDSRAPGYIIRLDPKTTDVAALAQALSDKYGFYIESVIYMLPMMIVGDLDSSIVAALRSGDRTLRSPFRRCRSGPAVRIRYRPVAAVH